MKQRCTIWNVWLTWLALPAVVLVTVALLGWRSALVVIPVMVAAQLAYLKFFPGISRWIGYGSVADEGIGKVAATLAPPKVTLYTANLCPFCPIVRRRLEALREVLGFELEAVDVTLRPQLVRAKGLRGVPVVEADGRLLHGNATSAQLAEFLGQGSVAAVEERAAPA